jgi:EpsI family protein
MDRTTSWLRFLLAAMLLAGAGLFLHARSGAERLPDRKELASFPLKVGDWTGTDIGIKADIREVLGDGDFLRRNYQRGSGQPPVDFFVAYFPTQRTGSTMHSPQNCLPGSGWMPVDHSWIELPRAGGGTVTVNRYIIAKGLDRQVALYWYQAHGRVVASEYWAKFYLVADAIRMNRSDGALIRILTPLGSGESDEAPQRRVVEFAQQVTPLLEGYIPL